MSSWCFGKRTDLAAVPALSQQLFLPYLRRRLCGRLLRLSVDQMLADDGYQWFVEQGGLTRENGQRFREAILSRGNSTDLAELYRQWRGHDPQIEPMLKIAG